MVLSHRYYVASVMFAPVVVEGHQHLLSARVEVGKTEDKTGPGYKEDAGKCETAIKDSDQLHKAAINDVWREKAMEEYSELRKAADKHSEQRTAQGNEDAKAFATAFDAAKANMSKTLAKEAQDVTFAKEAMAKHDECKAPTWATVDKTQNEKMAEHKTHLEAFVKRIDEIRVYEADPATIKAKLAAKEAAAKAGGKTEGGAATSKTTKTTEDDKPAEGSAAAVSMVGSVAFGMLAVLFV